jgi:hypothetical protein
MMSRDMKAPQSVTTVPTIGQWYIVSLSLSLATVTAAFVAWAQTSAWHFSGLSAYRLFPLFGLWAFSLLWTQYVMLALTRWQRLPISQLQRYFTVSSYAVLLLILLHPSILIAQLFHDGFGLPPGSYEHFVGADRQWLVLLGTLSLLVFLVYELHRWFKDRSWWRFVFYASDVAMLLIFYHALRLGDELPHGWYRGLWFVYGVTLLASLAYIHMHRASKAEISA